MKTRLDWDKYYMLQAKIVAIRSGCNSRPIGAVIVKDKRIIATGYNGTLPGQTQCTDRGENFCLRRSLKVDDLGEKKYQECPSIHAEQNAINQIAFNGGVSLYGASIYCTVFPCIFCLKNISSVGVKKIYYELIYESDDKERDSFWIKKASELRLETKQISLSKEDKKIIIPYIKNITSIRRF